MNTLNSIGLSALGACFLIGCSSKTEEVTEAPVPQVATSYRVAINRDLVVLKRDEGHWRGRYETTRMGALFG